MLAYFDRLEGDILTIALKIRELILKSEPNIEEFLSYGVPFYKRKRRLFYLYESKGELVLGFCRGSWLSDEAHILEGKDRKEVRTLRFASTKQGEWSHLASYLKESIILDDLDRKELEQLAQN